MKVLVSVVALTILPLPLAFADPPRVLDTTPTFNQRIFALLTLYVDEPDGIDGLGLSPTGARALKNRVLELKSDLRKYRETGHRFLCDNKETLRSNPIALAAHFDTDGQRFVQIVESAAKGFAVALDEADRAVVVAWMNENMDLAVVRLEGNPVREGKMSAEQVLARECSEQ